MNHSCHAKIRSILHRKERFAKGNNSSGEWRYVCHKQFSNVNFVSSLLVMGLGASGGIKE